MNEHRATYGREVCGFPSDLTDAEWERLQPLIPGAKAGGRPRKTGMRSAMNAILYLGGAKEGTTALVKRLAGS